MVKNSINYFLYVHMFNLLYCVIVSVLRLISFINKMVEYYFEVIHADWTSIGYDHSVPDYKCNYEWKQWM